MASKPALAAAHEYFESSLEPLTPARLATIIDAHFAPYLAAVEALRVVLDELPCGFEQGYDGLCEPTDDMNKARTVAEQALAAIDAQTPPDSERI